LYVDEDSSLQTAVNDEQQRLFSCRANEHQWNSPHILML